ncbi:uncharacterized protein LOC116114473 isoform X2 [Pistacia vera]|uniref:uncharacterized protein LOC116114473 isoform X2 n=1 Tax=Pistacia vera TaxID=55513 RepID=UPI0012630585|nr:uncharacterized protein LOC116114473 isoform X2 [Pistacia vera]XP_031256516.1 uncharacterized protein LOC116114473 isoform X2 [Pistacia vera]
MILKSGAMVAACRAFVVRPNCFASNINTEQLRTQLDQLHAEAETARSKVNSARLRLLRLSEAAEKLKRQAAISVHNGKENDARDLLFQKKKVMQAMEKSKNRIELLDELSAKLNEAISVKESQLIGNVALDLEVDREDPTRLVRIISPKQKAEKDTNEDKDLDPDALKLGDADTPVLQFSADSQANSPINREMEDFQGSVDVDNDAEDNVSSSLRGISSYYGFLKHLDEQFNNIEAELVTILNVSSLILNSKEKPENFKVQQTMELLESVCGIRGSQWWRSFKA